MKKILLLPVFALFTFFLHAEGNPNPCNECCITPCARKCSCDCAPYITLEFLYLKTYEDDLTFTDELNLLTLPIPLSIFNRDFQKVNFDWDPAFRVGVGYNLPCDCWDMSINWMYHSTNPKNKVVLNEPHFTLLITADQGHAAEKNGAACATEACENWKLNYNAIEVELGRHYCTSACTSVRPFIGLKTAWINQNLHVKYDGLFFVEPSPIGSIIGEFQGSQKYNGKGNFWGIGPRLGLNTKWYLGLNLNLFADFAGTLFVGSFDQKATIVNNNPNADVDPVIEKITRDQRTLVRPHAELIVGVEWSRCFCKTYFINLAVGYESQYFWDQMQIPYPGLAYPNGALSFNGLNILLRLDF